MGRSRDVIPVLENRMDKNMDNDMGSWFMFWCIGIRRVHPITDCDRFM